MDQRLLSWGLRPPFRGNRTIGSNAALRRLPHRLPRLWLFTDERRLADPRATVAQLPVGRAGVIFRHDGHPERTTIAADVARICRARRLTLIVAGDVRLAASLKAGIHLRGGRWPGPLRLPRLLTSSAHSVPDLLRARAAGASLVFLSPAFATVSHLGASGLGPLRWGAMARHLRSSASPGIAALGGVDGRSLPRLPRRYLHAAGAIGALQTS